MSVADPEDENDNPVTKRFNLMFEVTSLRRKMPKRLIQMDRKRQKLELRKLTSEEYPLATVREKLAEYAQKYYPEKQFRIPDWEADLRSVENAFKEVERNEAALEGKIGNRVDVQALLKKAEKIQKRLEHISIARKQLEYENPLITNALNEVRATMQKTMQQSARKTEKEEAIIPNKENITSEQMQEELLPQETPEIIS